MSFVRRKIDLSFQLGRGNFGEDGEDTVEVSGLRVSMQTSNTSGPGMGHANLRVYGLTLSVMNQLSRYLRLADGHVVTRFNNISIKAGDEGKILPTIFRGLMKLSAIQPSSMPDVCLQVAAIAGGFESVEMIPPTSIPNPTDVATLLAGLAEQAGLGFENNGVSVMLPPMYLRGSIRNQMLTAVEAARINWTIENDVIAIWPKNGSRGGEIALISPDTGMVGYPTNNEGYLLAVTTLFNPQLRLGNTVQVKSGLPYANGMFEIRKVSHELESEIPGGRWFTTVTASPFNADLYGPE